LDKYIDLIKPDVLLWQFCDNDFIENDLDLDEKSLDPTRLYKPYWVNGAIRYRTRSLSERVRVFARDYSRSLSFFIGRWDRFRAVRQASPIYDEIKNEGFGRPDFRRAFLVTDELVGMVRKRVGTIPIVAFNCSAGNVWVKAFRTISAHHDILFLEDVARDVERAANQGEDVWWSDGGHWAELGHQIAGNTLAKHLAPLFPVGLKLQGREDILASGGR
jgi:hypothetical protein